MIIFSPKTLPLSPFSHLRRETLLHPPEQCDLSCNSPRNDVVGKCELRSERGIEFDSGGTFFRHESATGRDLGVLSAALHRKSEGRLRVVDAMCGCGIRSLRYLAEAEADFVLANDANDDNRRVIVSNLSRVPRGDDDRRWVVTHNDASRILTDCYLQRDFYDLVDVDSFGSDSSYLRPAFNALKLGGLLYITSTDGYSSGGHRPYHSLASYGAYVRPVPFSNEVGLRMLIGGAVREASVLGYHVVPLFSYYSYHGPIFRVMLRFNRGQFTDHRHYGFISYCTRCGHTGTLSWNDLGSVNCPCNKEKGSSANVVIGPLWTGPLHDATYMTELLNLAEQWEWIGDGVGSDLDKLLRRMIDESNPELPAGFIKLDEIARRAKVNSPPINSILSSIQKEGFAASRSHIKANAIKTNCPMAACVRIAQELSSAE